MKNLIKIAVMLLIVASFLLTACSAPPQAVAKDQMMTARAETTASIEAMNDSKKELKKMQNDVEAKQAELKKLKAYEASLGMGE